jgi:phosphoribosylformimino-5-aminoimidazole carboxamide ribotide isomerase
MLSGPDVAGAAALQATGAQVILSGGVTSVDDIRRAVASGMAGIIVGRALYEGRLTLAAALAACQPAR